MLTLCPLQGPDYLSMVAGEARNPRKTMPTAFRATVYRYFIHIWHIWPRRRVLTQANRLCFFFIGSALAIGILGKSFSPSTVSGSYLFEILNVPLRSSIQRPLPHRSYQQLRTRRCEVPLRDRHGFSPNPHSPLHCQRPHLDERILGRQCLQ